jgi:hypothetical protein
MTAFDIFGAVVIVALVLGVLLFACIVVERILDI